MKLLYIANLLIMALVGMLIFIFKEITSNIMILNIVCLLVAIELPSIYMLCVNAKKVKTNDNELFAPSIFVVGITTIVDIVFYSISISVSSTNIKLFVLYTFIFHCTIIALLLIIKVLTNYIRNQH